METTVVTENTEAQEQQKSDVDSDCGQDSSMPLHSAPTAQFKNNLTLDEIEEGQKRSVDDLADLRPGFITTESPKPRQNRGRTRSQPKESTHAEGYPKGEKMGIKQLQSITQRNRVNGVVVQNKGTRSVKDAEKLRHVNEA